MLPYIQWCKSRETLATLKRKKKGPFHGKVALAVWCIVFSLAMFVMGNPPLPIHQSFSRETMKAEMTIEVSGSAAEKPSIPTDSKERCNPEDIREMSRLIKNNLGRMGLRPVDVAINSSFGADHERNRSFPGLTKESLSSTLRGKRIAMMGDSQLWYFSKWLNFLLDEDVIGLLSRSFQFQNGAKFDGFDSMGMNSAYEHSDQWLRNVCGVKWNFHESVLGRSTNVSACDYYWNPTDMYLPKDGTRLLWSGLAQPMDHRVTEKKLANMFNVTKQLGPNIIVVNMGIHWLHFYNIARDVSLQGIRRWIRYEEWLQQVFDFAYTETQATVLLYKTTNFICDKKLYNHFRVAHEGYSARNAGIIQNCSTSISRLDPTYFSTEKGQSNLLDYCVNGTINNRGTSALNRRMRSFLQKKNILRTHHRESSSPPLHVDIFDDSMFQSCEYCPRDDGMHYHELNLLRTRLLANQVACLES